MRARSISRDRRWVNLLTLAPEYFIFMAKHADHRYLKALRENDSRVLRELYESSFPKIAGWVRNNSGTDEDARDLFQEAMVTLYQAAHKPNYELTCPISALIFSICRNKWIDAIRKKSRGEKVREAEQERYDREAQYETALEELEEATLRKRKLDATFQQLSATCQELMKLLGKGVSSGEAAKKMGMSNANTVYRRKNACLKRWRELLTSLK